jgi:hypothetical protein
LLILRTSFAFDKPPNGIPRDFAINCNSEMLIEMLACDGLRGTSPGAKNLSCRDLALLCDALLCELVGRDFDELDERLDERELERELNDRFALFRGGIRVCLIQSAR